MKRPVKEKVVAFWNLIVVNIVTCCSRCKNDKE